MSGSSQDLNSAVEPWAESDKGVLEENNDVLHDAEEDGEGDVFEDAATGQQQQEDRTAVEQEEGREAGVSPVRVRAPISDEIEEEPDDEEDDDDDAEDEEASLGSNESFDSALERIAASSTGSYDTASSPKGTSPVGSLTGPGRHPSILEMLSPSQQGALMRLNEMLTGDASLDTSVIENSTGEEFKERIAELAGSLGQNRDDASFGSIEDALLPLVLESAERNQSTAGPADTVNVIQSSRDMDEEPIPPQSPMPRVKLTVEDAPDDGNVDEGQEHGAVGNGDRNEEDQSPMPRAKLTADDEHDDVDDEENEENEDEEFVEEEVEEEEEEDLEVSHDSEQAPKAVVNSVSGTDSGKKEDFKDAGEAGKQPEVEESVSPPASAAVNPVNGEQPLQVRAMPLAKLSGDDDDNGGSEEREEAGDDEKSTGSEEQQDEVEPGDSPYASDEEIESNDAGQSVNSQPIPKAKVIVEHDGGVEEREEGVVKDAEQPMNVQTVPPVELTEVDDGANEKRERGGEGKSAPSEVPEMISDKPLEELAGKIGEDIPEEISESKIVNAEAPGAPEVAETARDFSKPADGGAAGGVADRDLSKVVDDAPKAEQTSKIPSETVRIADERVPVHGDDREFVHVEEADQAGNSDEESEEEEEDDGDVLLERPPTSAREADTPSLGSAGPSLPARPTRQARPLGPAPRVVQQQRAASAQISSSDNDGQSNGDALDGNEETREKLQLIRVKFLRLALRLGQSAHNVVVAQVLYRLGLAEQLRGGRSNSRTATFSFDRASAIAEEQEAAGPEELDFTCTIMLLGKTGVGKSATINSIFDEPKTGTNAFKPSTNKVQVVTGLVHGIKVRVIDTPGLLPSVADQRRNEKVMRSVKSFIKKQSPDIVLYFDRLDMQSRDYGDLPLLRTITDTFGAAVWFNAIVVLTHAASAPPDGPNGLPLSYEMFVAQRSHVVQQTIRQAAGDMRLMNPVSLVENHPACRVNRVGERVLPNGQVWKPQLLLLCFASKILAEANALLKLQDNTPGRPFGARPRVPPLPFLLSSLLQSRAQLKLPHEQVGDEDESDEELEEDETSDEEEDYDQLPPFRRLSKDEVAELDEDNRAKYFEELAERERLFQKKQWKEEVKRRRELKKRMAEASREESQLADEGLEDDMSRSGDYPVPLPDMALPPSFDSENPAHRYRYLEAPNQWVVRPVLETHGWDHDTGYDGLSLEKMFVVGDNIPASVSGQITKDKKEASVNMECAASLKHGEGKVTLAGLDIQTIGKDLGYTLRSETRFSNFKGNKTTGGLALTLLGDTISAGLKVEDRLVVGKRLKLVVSGGAITGRGDAAYGGSLEATLRDKDYPLSRTLTTLGLSIMDWHGDLAVGGNLQSQFVLGKTMMVGRANLNNRGAGQISIRASSSEQLQMALIGVLPVIRTILNRLFGSQQQQ